MSLDVFFQQEALPQLDALRSFAYQLCRDKNHTDDLVQETMLKACRYFHTYREGTNCRAWLFQICKNSYINEYRRKQYEPLLVDFQEMHSGSPGNNPDVERETHPPVFNQPLDGFRETDLLDDEVMTALQKIPADYQTALILSDIEGYTYEEIASFMQAPIGTIRSRIHRGRRMLANHLAGYGSRLGKRVS
jgi:RNA polymerase sigma-70 factor (ECF subfamily)